MCCIIDCTIIVAKENNSYTEFFKYLTSLQKNDLDFNTKRHEQLY